MKPVNLNGPQPPDNVDLQRTPYTRSRESVDSTTSTTKGGDRINVSNRGEEIRNLVSKANQQSTFREDLVESLRMLIASGRYDVPSKEISEAILKDENLY